MHERVLLALSSLNGTISSFVSATNSISEHFIDVLDSDAHAALDSDGIVHSYTGSADSPPALQLQDLMRAENISTKAKLIVAQKTLKMDSYSMILCSYIRLVCSEHYGTTRNYRARLPPRIIIHIDV